MTVNFHLKSSPTSGMVIQDWSLMQRFGHGVNLQPQIDREGHLISSFLPGLIKRIIEQRDELIMNSHQALEINWLFRFKELIINSISLIDITLLQLYTKAQYNPEPNWTFDIDIVGVKHARRISDKLKWVKQISGTDPNISNELDSLMTLKNLRNHLSHFDPPCFVASLEEISDWLNMVLDIATINYKIRMALGVKLSEDLMTFMVQPEVEFVPQSVFTNRAPENRKYTGYKTSTWKPKKKKPQPSIPKWKLFMIDKLNRIVKKLEETSS